MDVRGCAPRFSGFIIPGEVDGPSWATAFSSGKMQVVAGGGESPHSEADFPAGLPPIFCHLSPDIELIYRDQRMRRERGDVVPRMHAVAERGHRRDHGTELQIAGYRAPQIKAVNGRHLGLAAPCQGRQRDLDIVETNRFTDDAPWQNPAAAQIREPLARDLQCVGG
jgi:hypothetical protein